MVLLIRTAQRKKKRDESENHFYFFTFIFFEGPDFKPHVDRIMPMQFPQITAQFGFVADAVSQPATAVV